MTPKDEIDAWKRLARSWKLDCQRYEALLKRIREFADRKATTAPPPHHLDWQDISHAISGDLANDDDCLVCGEHHEDGSIPLTCITGDGE